MAPFSISTKSLPRSVSALSNRYWVGVGATDSSNTTADTVVTSVDVLNARESVTSGQFNQHAPLSHPNLKPDDTAGEDSGVFYIYVSGKTQNKAFICKYNFDGTLIKSITFPTTTHIEKVVVDKDDLAPSDASICAVGWDNANGTDNGYIARFDVDLNLEWHNLCTSTEGDTRFYSCTPGGEYSVGYANDGTRDNAYFCHWNTSTGGNTAQRIYYQGSTATSYNERFYGITVNPLDNNLILCGYFNGDGVLVELNETNYDVVSRHWYGTSAYLTSLTEVKVVAPYFVVVHGTMNRVFTSSNPQLGPETQIYMLVDAGSSQGNTWNSFYTGIANSPANRLTNASADASVDGLFVGITTTNNYGAIQQMSMNGVLHTTEFGVNIGTTPTDYFKPSAVSMVKGNKVAAIAGTWEPSGVSNPDSRILVGIVPYESPAPTYGNVGAGTTFDNSFDFIEGTTLTIREETDLTSAVRTGSGSTNGISYGGGWQINNLLTFNEDSTTNRVISSAALSITESKVDRYKMEYIYDLSHTNNSV